MDQKSIKLQMKKICDFVGNFMRSLVVKGLKYGKMAVFCRISAYFRLVSIERGRGQDKYFHT